jgi:hypothetical protein
LVDGWLKVASADGGLFGGSAEHDLNNVGNGKLITIAQLLTVNINYKTIENYSLSFDQYDLKRCPKSLLVSSSPFDSASTIAQFS